MNKNPLVPVPDEHEDKTPSPALSSKSFSPGSLLEVFKHKTKGALCLHEETGRAYLKDVDGDIIALETPKQIFRWIHDCRFGIEEGKDCTKARLFW